MTLPSQPSDRRETLRGALCLFCAAILWGFGFVAQKETTVVGLTPLWAMTVRFLLAVPVALAFGARGLLRPRVPIEWRRIWPLGVLLGACNLMQYVAMTETPVARVSLITGLYVAFTPLLAPLFGHARPGAGHWAGALLAFLGLAGLTGVVGAVSVPLNSGDLVTLVQAVLVAVHLLVVSRVGRHIDPFALNAIQVSMVAALCVPAALLFDGVPTLPTSTAAWVSFAYLAVPSTVVAFALQIAGQRHTAPATASVIMLLEAPIGAVAATLWFAEDMSAGQALAALVLVAGVGLSIAAELRRRHA